MVPDDQGPEDPHAISTDLYHRPPWARHDDAGDRVSAPDGIADQHGRVVDQLRAVHTLKPSALRMFDPMLAAVEAERRNPTMTQVEDLLGNMLNAFGGHRTQTAEHVRRLEQRLTALNETPHGTVTHGGMGLGAALRAKVGGIGGQNHGANARDAFVFEHLEIALLELLERAARRAGDVESGEVAHACLIDDQAMAAKITRNWENVLSLTLASKQIPFERPSTASDATPTQEDPTP